MYVIPNPTKLKACYDAIQQQVSRFTSNDYYTDQQLATAKAILVRSKIRQMEKPSSLPSQLSYYWCSASFNYDTDLVGNYQKVTRADIDTYLNTYIKGKPLVAGIILKPELNKQANVNTFFTSK
jgi:zinc protease